MRYLYLLVCVVFFGACTTTTDKIVVPVNYFNISFNGHSYGETSDAQHPITVSAMASHDLFAGPVSIASISVNTKNITTFWAGENPNPGQGTGTYSVGLRDLKDSTECPYTLIDKGSGGEVYQLDTLSTFSISTYNTNQITGSFTLNLWDLGVPGTVYTATGSFTYNFYFGKL